MEGHNLADVPVGDILPASPQLIVRHIFFSYSAALRWWLAASENPEWRSGVREFAEILKLQANDLNLRSDLKEKARPIDVAAATRGRAKAVSARTNGTAKPHVLKTDRSRRTKTA